MRSILLKLSKWINKHYDNTVEIKMNSKIKYMGTSYEIIELHNILECEYGKAVKKLELSGINNKNIIL